MMRAEREGPPEAADESEMEATTRLYCCPPLTAAMSPDAARADSRAALVVRAGPGGALYFKITNGVHEAFDHNVNEPVAFCPFCGQKLATLAAAAAATVGAETLRMELPPDDEQTVVAAAGRSPLILVGA